MHRSLAALSAAVRDHHLHGYVCRLQIHQQMQGLCTHIESIVTSRVDRCSSFCALCRCAYKELYVSRRHSHDAFTCMWLLQEQSQLQTHGLENAPHLQLGFWQAYVTGSCSVCLCLQRQRRIQAPSATAQAGLVESDTSCVRIPGLTGNCGQLSTSANAAPLRAHSCSYAIRLGLWLEMMQQLCLLCCEHL